MASDSDKLKMSRLLNLAKRFNCFLLTGKRTKSIQYDKCEKMRELSNYALHMVLSNLDTCCGLPRQIVIDLSPNVVCVVFPMYGKYKNAEPETL